VHFLNCIWQECPRIYHKTERLGGINLKALYNPLFILCFFSSLAVAQTQVTYTYDELGRVTAVTDSVNGDRAYDYDAAGNRKTLVVNTVGNRPPVTVNDSLTVSPLYTSFTINPTLNDSDPDGDTLTVTSFTSSGAISTSRSGNVFTILGTYAPSTGTVIYTVSDGKGGSATGTISVTTR